MAGQVAYHLMSAAGMVSAPWLVTTFVSCLPVGVLGCGAALAHLLNPRQGGSAMTTNSDKASSDRSNVIDFPSAAQQVEDTATDRCGRRGHRGGRVLTLRSTRQRPMVRLARPGSVAATATDPAGLSQVRSGRHVTRRSGSACTTRTKQASTPPALRCTGCGWRTGRRSARCALVAATTRFVSDAEGRPARSATATADNAELYLKLSQQRDRRVAMRLVGLIMAVLVAAVSGVRAASRVAELGPGRGCRRGHRRAGQAGHAEGPAGHWFACRAGREGAEADQ